MTPADLEAARLRQVEADRARAAHYRLHVNEIEDLYRKRDGDMLYKMGLVSRFEADSMKTEERAT